MPVTPDEPKPSPDDLLPGSNFGGYEVVRKLGRGAFGGVYEALRMPLRKRCALKVLHREYVNYPDVINRFLREAEIVAQVDHPHIVAVFDLGIHDGRPFLAMEFLDGESLADRLDREGVIPPAEAVDLLLAVMSAVATVHERGVVHRDLKPDNVFLARNPTGQTQPKLLDFGVAKVKREGRPLTMSRAMVGTPSYMAPEQAQEARDVGPAADQWSLAVILFEALTGQCPFEGRSLLEILNAVTSKPVPRLRTFSPALPQGLDDVLFRAMQRPPLSRWPSVQAFGEALRPYASVAGQANWAPFYTAEIAYVPTLHQWGDAAEPAPAPPLARPLADLSRALAVPQDTLALPPTPRRTDRTQGLLFGAGAMLMTMLLGGVWLAYSRAHAAPTTSATTVTAPAAPQPAVPTPVTVVAAMPRVAPALAAPPMPVAAPVVIAAPTAPAPRAPVVAAPPPPPQPVAPHVAPVRPVRRAPTPFVVSQTLGY